MGFWSKKKKNNQQRQVNHQQPPVNHQQVANNRHSYKVTNQPEKINQQTSRFSINPEFFDYEKIKFNAFLTDSEEYNKKKMIDDLANGDPRHMKHSRDQIELKARYKADEQAFKEIYTNINNKELYNNLDFDHFKTKALSQAKKYENEDARRPINTRVVDVGFYQDVGKKMDNDIEKIGQETRKFLRHMETKILDINNINEPFINQAVDYERGGNAPGDYYLSNTVVNRFGKLKAINDKFHSNNTNVTSADFENLRLNNFNHNQEQTESSSNKTATNFLEMRTRNLNDIDQVKNQEKETAIPVSKVVNQQPHEESINNQPEVLNIINQSKQILDSNKTLDEIVAREINKDVSNYEKIQPEIRKNITNLLFDEHNFIKDLEPINNTSKQTIVNEQKELAISNDFNDYIPVNEIKMDLRIRKAERRNFVFNTRGHF